MRTRTYLFSVSLSLLFSLAPCYAQVPRVYWSHHSGVVQSVNSDGSEFLSFDLPGAETYGLAVHGPRRTLYTVEHFPELYYSIYETQLDGANPKMLVTNVGLHIAVDVTHDKLYWDTSTEIMRSNLDGTGREIVVNRFNPGLVREDNLAVDGINRYLYWTENGRPFRSGLNGENPESLFGITDPDIPFTGITTPPTDGSVCFSTSKADGVFLTSGVVSCVTHDGKPLLEIGTPDPMIPFLPRYVVVGFGNQPFWFDGYTQAIQTVDSSIIGSQMSIRTVFDVNHQVRGLAVDDYVIPEPPMVLLTLAAALLAAAAASRHRLARRRLPVVTIQKIIQTNPGSFDAPISDPVWRAD